MSDQIEVALVDSFDEAMEFKRWLGERRNVLAWDIETSGLDPFRDKVRLTQFGDARTGWAIPHDDWRGLVREVMEKYDGPMVAHNMKFDSSFYAVEKIHVPRPRMHDTMTMLFLYDNLGPKALKPAGRLHLGGWAARGQEELKSAMKKGKWGWNDIPLNLDEFWTYSAMDTVVTAQLAEKIWPKIQRWRTAYEREIAVTWVLLDMEMRGVRIDVDYCKDMYVWLKGEHDEICSRWPEINLHSSAQVADALKAEGVTLTSRTEKGALSLDDVVLESIDHPLAEDVLAARYRKKLFGTYFGPFLELEVDGRIHPNIRPLGAEKHGRMSVGRPAMQGIPRTNAVRGAVIPSDDNKLLLVDYEAQEMRMLVHYSQDAGLIQALRDEVDLHKYAASEIYGIPQDDVTKAQRTTAKWTGFSKVYGAGPPRIAATAGVPLDKAKEFLDRYDRKFPGVVRFQRKVAQAVRERERSDGHGWVETWGGRKLGVPQGKAYVAVNYIISGGCADLTKEAMVRMDRAGVGQYMILPIHDEVIFDVPEKELEEARATIRECMEYDDISVPLTTEQQVVDSWGDVYPAVVDMAIRKSRRVTRGDATGDVDKLEVMAAAWTRDASADERTMRSLTRGANTELAQADGAEVCPKCGQAPNSRRTKMANFAGPRCDACGQPIMLKRGGDEGSRAWAAGQKVTQQRAAEEAKCKGCGQIPSGRTRSSYTGPRCRICGEPTPEKVAPKREGEE